MRKRPTHVCLGTGDSKEMPVTKTSNCLVGSKQPVARAEIKQSSSPGARPTAVVTASCQVTSESPQGAAAERGAWSSCESGGWGVGQGKEPLS